MHSILMAVMSGSSLVANVNVATCNGSGASCSRLLLNFQNYITLKNQERIISCNWHYSINSVSNYYCNAKVSITALINFCFINVMLKIE